MTNSPPVPPPSAPSAALLTWKNALPWLLGILGIVIVGSGLFFLIRQFNTATAIPLFTPSTLDLTSLLAPFVLLATVIERFWEGLFDLYERIAVQLAARLGVASPETAGLWSNLKTAEAQLASATDDDSRAQALAEVRDARVALLDIYETLEYKGIKRGIIIIGSLVIGVALCVSQRIGVFEAIGFTGIAPLTDVIFTGLLIGAGPGPMHSFISILQELRDTIAGLGNYAQSQAWQNFKNAQYPQPVLASAPVLPAPDEATSAAAPQPMPTPTPQTALAEPLPDPRTQRQIREILRRK
jgi:hypothetical protein